MRFPGDYTARLLLTGWTASSAEAEPLGDWRRTFSETEQPNHFPGES